jgi:phage gp36-like protein
MAFYCLDKNVRAILTNIDRDAIDPVRVGEFIGDAGAEIDTILSRRFTVPFADYPNTPPIIKVICRDIAAFYTMRVLFVGENQNKSDWTLELYNKAIKLLKDIADKKYDIRDIDGAVIADSNVTSKVYSKIKSYSPVFELDDAEDWAVSANRLDDVADMRNE